MALQLKQRAKMMVTVAGLCFLLSDCTQDHGQGANIAGFGFPHYAYPLDGYRSFDYRYQDRGYGSRWEHH